MRDTLTANLATIASHYTGQRVIVTWQSSPYWRGLAYRTDAGAVIALHPALTPDEVGHVFFHEVGHHVLDHVQIVASMPLATLATVDTDAIMQRLTAPERDHWDAQTRQHEAQADSWATVALAVFERRFGPFWAAVNDGA